MSRTCVAVALVAGFVIGLQARLVQAAPPVLEISQGALDSGALDPFVGQIDAYIKYYADQIGAAKDKEDDKIVQARGELVNGFGKYENSAKFQYIYTREADKLLLPLLADAATANKNLKQVNVALALSKMNAASVQDALVQMVAHPNPAVRLLGWRGYYAPPPSTLAAVRNKVLGLMQAETDIMFKAIKAQIDKEQSPLVLTAIFQVLAFPATRPGEVPEKVYTEAQKRSLDAIMSTWPNRCLQVRQNAEFVGPCRTGAATLSILAQGLAGEKDYRKKALQGLIDMGWSAAKGYESGNALDSYGMLAQDCENAMNTVKKSQTRYIEAQLGDTKLTPQARAAGLSLGILKWADDLKADGVTEPKQDEPAPTPAATSAPAAAPAAPK